MRCLPLCGRVKTKREKKKRRERRVVTIKEEKIVRWAIDDKEDWEGKKRSKRTIEKLRKWSQKNS